MAEQFDQKKIVDQSDVIASCDRFEAELTELRAAYEQHFLGLDRRPPVSRHAEVRRHLLELKGMWVRQTAAKFRVQAAAQKYATYDRLWQRTMQEIEAGTYQRDVQRAKRRHPNEAPAAQKKNAPGAEVSEAGEPAPAPAAARVPSTPPTVVSAPSAGATAPPGAAAPALPPRIASVAPPRAAPGAVPPAALSDEALRGVYDAYLVAKKRCNEDTSKLSFEQLAQTLRRQVPELMKKHQARGIEFKVVIKDGKALLRAVPKNG
jgi:hypothetical protein